jgi:multidrug efflux pump subunit AcrB
MVEQILKRKKFILVFILILTFIGIYGYWNLRQNLFPDSDRPQIAVVTIEPNSTADYVAEHVSRPIEKELYTISGVRRVYSTSQDGISIVTAEFTYEKGLDAAAIDVTNTLSKVKNLPSDIKPQQIYKISSYTPPVMVISLSIKKGSTLTLPDIRYIADNSIKDYLSNIREIGNVDIFGGEQKEIQVEVDKNKLFSYGLNIWNIIGAVQKSNRDLPLGLIQNDKYQNTFKMAVESDNVDNLKDIYITSNIKLGDVANISYGIPPQTSGYHGNGAKAIALAIQRPIGGATLDTIKAMQHALPVLQKKFPSIDFKTTETQKDLIEKSNTTMIDALRDAIVMVFIVMLLFLGDVRITVISAISIPFVYLGTLGLMWLLGIEKNMVTLTAVILALGMLVDDAVVVLENIERHLSKLKEDIKAAVIKGTEEVMLAVFAGTFATASVIFPLMFIGGYPEHIYRPLVSTLLIAIFISYFISITFIPLMGLYLLKPDRKENKLEKVINDIMAKFLNPLKKFYIESLDYLLHNKKMSIGFTVLLVIILIFSLRILIPLAGRDLMPPMDTGIVKINIQTDSNMNEKQVEMLLFKVEGYIKSMKGYETISSAIGSEPGIFTIGSGPTQNISMTVYFVDRFKRKNSIWQIEENIRKYIHSLPNIAYSVVYDYGASPLSTIKSTVDVMVSGSSIEELNSIGKSIMKAMYKTRGLTDIRPNWTLDNFEYYFRINKAEAALYFMTPYDVASQIAPALSGSVSSIFSIPNEDGLDIRVIVNKNQLNNISKFESFLIKTPRGFVPLSAIGTFDMVPFPTYITRQGMNYTLDMDGYRSTVADSHIMDNLANNLKNIKLPYGYSISQEGDSKEMSESTVRLARGIAMGLFLLFAIMVIVFNSWKSPIAIMIAIPLSMIGGVFSLLITGKHMCLPAIMGFVLLAGIIVKNSILLIDFINEAINRGLSLEESLKESVNLRTRPILMTAFATAVGMIPIAMQLAIGLERLSPLAVVAIGGLILGTFLTLIYVPLFYSYMYRKEVRK